MTTSKWALTPHNFMFHQHHTNDFLRLFLKIKLLIILCLVAKKIQRKSHMDLPHFVFGSQENQKNNPKIFFIPKSNKQPKYQKDNPYSLICSLDSFTQCLVAEKTKRSFFISFTKKPMKTQIQFLSKKKIAITILLLNPNPISLQKKKPNPVIQSKFSDPLATTKGFPLAKQRHERRRYGRKKRVRFGLEKENKIGLLYSALVILIHSAMEKRD